MRDQAAALLLLAKGMALDHADERIRVNTLSPGGIATQGMADQWGGMERAEREWGRAMHPIGRLGRVEEIARAALFLASDEFSFVTGTDSCWSTAATPRADRLHDRRACFDKLSTRKGSSWHPPQQKEASS